jgi:hypothetical protein
MPRIPIWRITLSLVGVCVITLANAQRTVTEAAKAKGRKEFVEFEIPSLINGSKLDPSPITNLAVDLGDERVTLKTGFQLVRSGVDGYKWTMTIAPYAQASDGVSTVFSQGKGLSDYGFAMGVNRIWRTNYNATDAGARVINKALLEQHDSRAAFIPEGADKPTLDTISKGDRVSLLVQWLAVRYNMDRAGYTLFEPTGSFTTIQTDRDLALAQGYLSYNLFFESALPRYKWRNLIASVGAGYASFSNYRQLPERELIEGTIIYNSDSSVYRTVAETTQGREGSLKISTGLTVYGELYKTIVGLNNAGAIRLGLRYTQFGLGTEEANSTASGGFFITTKKKPDKDGNSEDAANFSITVRFDQFQRNDEPDYLQQYAKVLIGAAIPLRFR